MSRRRRPGLLTAALAIVAAGAVALALTAVGSPSATSSAAVTRTVAVQHGVISSTVTGSGNLAPADQENLDFATSGELTHVYVSVGDHVVEGQLLAQIDPSSQQVALAQAQADLQSAQDALADAEAATSTTTTASDPSTSAAVATTAQAPVIATTAQAPAATTTPSAATTTTTAATAPAPASTTTTTTTTTTKPPATTTTTKAAPAPKPAEPATRHRVTTVTTPSGAATTATGTSTGGGTGGGSSTLTVAAATADLESAQLSVTSAEKALAATKLFAPLPGTVTTVNGSVGDTVGSGSSSSSSSNTSSSSSSSPTIARGLGGGGAATSSSGSSSSSSAFIVLSQLSRLSLDVALTESDIGKVKVGQPATVTVSATGDELSGHVSSIGLLPSSSSGGSTSAVSYPVTIELDQSAPTVRSGMSASASIVTSQVSGIAVPSQAITGGTVTVVRNGKNVSVPVQTGVVGDSTTEVVSGLNVGDTIVVRSVTATATPSATGTGTGATGTGGFGGGGSGGGGFGGGGGGGFRARLQALGVGGG